MNEVIPVTGSLFSGSDEVKYYINITSGSEVSGGFFETVYDGSPSSLSSSALVDLTYGHSVSSSIEAYSETFLNDEKKRVYKEMAQKLLGDKDALFTFNSITYHELFFLLLRRRIYKDEVKKGNTTIELDVSSGSANDKLNLTDNGAASTFTIGDAGDEADLISGSTAVGKVYYQQGIVVFPTGVFDFPAEDLHWSGSATTNNASLAENAVSGNINALVDGLRNRISQVDFHNQTNLHSTIFFARKTNSEFNYSSNPTFIDSDGRIIPTSGSDNQTRTYCTKVGLYDINSNLLSVASLSEPIKYSPDSETVIRVRLSY